MQLPRMTSSELRKNVIEALNDLDWKGYGITISVRINGLDTQLVVSDVVDRGRKGGHAGWIPY